MKNSFVVSQPQFLINLDNIRELNRLTFDFIMTLESSPSPSSSSSPPLNGKRTREGVHETSPSDHHNAAKRMAPAPAAILHIRLRQHLDDLISSSSLDVLKDALCSTVCTTMHAHASASFVSLITTLIGNTNTNHEAMVGLLHNVLPYLGTRERIMLGKELQKRGVVVRVEARTYSPDPFPAKVFFNHFLPFLSPRELFSIGLVSTSWFVVSSSPRALLLVKAIEPRQMPPMRILQQFSRSVTSLDLSAMSVSLDDQALMHFCRHLPNLTHLCLEGCKRLTDQGTAIVARSYWSKLEVLSLKYCSGIASLTLTTVAAECTELRHLNLNYVAARNEHVAAILQKCAHLHTLSLKYCRAIGNAAFEAGLTKPYQGAVLTLSYCAELTDQGVACIAKYCPHLRDLDVKYCREITDASLLSLRKCSELQSVKFNYCARLQDAGVTAFVGAGLAQALRELQLVGCIELHDKALEEVAKRCPQLKTLCLDGCTQLSARSVYCLAQRTSPPSRVELSSCTAIEPDALIELAKKMAQSVRVQHTFHHHHHHHHRLYL